MVAMGEKAIKRGNSRLVENTIALALAGLFSLVFTLIQLGTLSRFLNESVFGAFIALRGFHLLLATILLVGLPQVLVRFLPSYKERGDSRKALLLFTGSAVIVIALGVLFYTLSGVWSGWMPGGLKNHLGEGEVIMWIALSSISLALKLLLYGGFNGLRLMRLQTVLELVYLGLFTLYILLLRNTLGIMPLFKAIFWLNLFVCAVGYPVYFVISGRMIEERTRRPAETVIPSLGSYWGFCLLLSLVALAFTDLDRFLMSSMLPVAAISLFHVASRVNFLIKRFLGFPIIALQPEITRVYEEGRWDELKDRIRLFTRVTFIASLLFASIAAITGRHVITVISGAGYSQAYRVLLVLLPTVPVAAFIAPLLVTMKGLHYIKWAFLCDLAWMVVYFGSFPLFVDLLGITGMAVAQLLGSAAQMSMAVKLSKREGFYGGLGVGVYKVLILLAVTVPVGILFTNFGGIWASGASILLFPFICRVTFGKLGLFDREEVSRIMDMIDIEAGRKIAGWFLMAGER